MPDFIHTKVDPDRLSVTADDIDSCLDSLERAFLVIDDSIKNTLTQAWSSVAENYFLQQYTVDKKLFTSQVKTLRAFNQQLKEASGIFDNADAKARDLVNNLRIG